MKRAKCARLRRIKPRNPLLVPAIQRQAGAHQRTDKRASRARQRARLRKELDDI